MPTLAAALAKVASREPWLQVCGGEPSGEGWSVASDLLTPAALDELVRTGAHRLAADHPRASVSVTRNVAAAVLLDHWGWALAVAGAGTLAATGQVLDLAPDRVRLRLQRGQVTGIAIGGFSTARAEAGLRSELAEHLGRLHELLTGGQPPLLRRSARLLRGGIGDAVATALATQAEQLDDDERRRLTVLSDRLIADGPGWGVPGRLVVDGAGPQELRTRRRTSCCLWYRLPDEQPCVTCPRLTEAERATRLLAEATTRVGEAP